MENTVIGKIKALLPKTLIETVPAELQEEFDNIQLENSIRRIRVLTVIAIIAKIGNVIFSYLTNSHLQYNQIINFIDYSEVAMIVLFNLAIVFFRKTCRKGTLWILCYLAMAGFFIIYEFFINRTETVQQIPFIFFVSIFLFTVIPDFKPKIFLSFAVLYFIATAVISIFKGQAINEYYGIQSHNFYIFLFIIITKILLYNKNVRTFVNTYKINKLNENLVSANEEIIKQKEELRNYNDNLERMVAKKTERIVELRNAVMETIAELVERRDNATGGHIERTSKFLKIIIEAMQANKLYGEHTASWNIDQMILSAQLHDVGKIGIDDNILRKPEKLTKEEFDAMKKHSRLGGEIIKEIQKKTGEKEFLNYAYTFAVYHHEKWNGTGYPYGCAGKNIPLPARLMTLIDVYDALISERPYKRVYTHEEAIEIIKEGKGTHFDPDLTDLFLSVSDKLHE